MKNPVDALLDVADAVGRVIGDGLTLAAEILCPRDHLAEERLRSWERAAVAVEDEICDEADACEADDFVPTFNPGGPCPDVNCLLKNRDGSCDRFCNSAIVYGTSPRLRPKDPAAVSAAADGAADHKAASPTPVGVEGPEGASAIPPAAPSGQPASELLWDLTQAVLHLSQFGPISTEEFQRKYNPLLGRAFDRFYELQAVESDPGEVSPPSPGEQVREDDLAAHITATRLAWAEQEISDVDLTGAITRSLLADFNITRK